MARKITQFAESGSMNNLSYMIYVERLTELSISTFEWKNLPDEIDERFMEIALFQDGQAVFFKDEELGEYLALRCLFGAPLNVYNIPTWRKAYAANGYNHDLNIDNSVMIFNNRLHTNSYPAVEWYARRLWDLDRICDVNVKAQKTPVLIVGTPEQRLTLKNLYKQYDGNEPFIFGDKNFDFSDSLRALSTGAPFIADRVYMLKTQIWDEALTYLGINNVNVQKKERMFTREIVANQGAVNASRYSRLESRRRACDEINKMFGLDIWCDFREQEIEEPDDEEQDAYEKNFDSAGINNIQV